MINIDWDALLKSRQRVLRVLAYLRLLAELKAKGRPIIEKMVQRARERAKEGRDK